MEPLMISDLISIAYGTLLCEHILYTTFLNNTVMCCVTMFQSLTDCIYDGGTIRL